MEPRSKQANDTLASATERTEARTDPSALSERASRISRLELELEEARRDLLLDLPLPASAPAPSAADPSRALTRPAPPPEGGDDGVFARATVRRAIALPASMRPAAPVDASATQVTGFLAPDATIPTGVPFVPHPEPLPLPEASAPNARRSGATWPPAEDAEPATAPDADARTSSIEAVAARPARTRAHTAGRQAVFAVTHERPSFLTSRTPSHVDGSQGGSSSPASEPLREDELRVVRPPRAWRSIVWVLALALVALVGLALVGLLGAP